jgi:AAA family ATP:ADP antiporter
MTPVTSLDALLLRGLTRAQRQKGLLLSAWFCLVVATLWVMKPVRVASLLAHLGAEETPYVRLAGVATIAVAVAAYDRAVDRLSRLGVVVWVHALYAAASFGFWVALVVGGASLGASRAFVWALYVLIELQSVIVIGVFWTYTNDVVTEDESHRLYGVIGLGGIVGGVLGGAFVDALAKRLGAPHLLAVGAALVVASAAFATYLERTLKPAPRAAPTGDAPAPALGGAREVLRSPYLACLVGIVAAYEFTATLTDFGVSVVFERSYSDEATLAQMYGRLGWVVSATAIAAQLVLVPLLLPRRRLALLAAPTALLLGVVGLLASPLAGMAFVLSAADRGLNYSIQQATKESLYVPLSDAQKYKAKAFIDMFVDRAAKALAAFALIAVLAAAGTSVRATLSVAVVSTFAWIAFALRLSREAT